MGEEDRIETAMNEKLERSSNEGTISPVGQTEEG